MDQQVCITVGAGIIASISSVVAAASTVANFVPEPEKISNPVLRFLSRAVHFVALDIVTSVKKAS